MEEYFQKKYSHPVHILCEQGEHSVCVFESVNDGSRRPLELITVGMSLHTPSPVKIIRCVLIIRYCAASSMATLLN